MGTFGDRLANIRKDKGLSQKQLADLLGYKQPASISGIESGKNPVDVNALVKIAEIFQVDLHWLITGEDRTLERTLETIVTMDHDAVYRQHADLFSRARTIFMQLQEKQQTGQQLTEQELEEMQTNGRLKAVLSDRLHMLLNLKHLSTGTLRALLENLKRDK